ncbi:hypothetical protein DSCW_31810 [Desulfosarcina widdelii]|uniref:Uncharacterized protein n=1 Tax=Desulfosarcina widdelii TaxID=947919 RepID=A0A5K7ZBE1_9BACT|nr:hypothetical protein [Desulfosarcina widdelii]BBO75764.1 hypothetical protein DSCW_31810 [Desulfosarcina widdelii]
MQTQTIDQIVNDIMTDMSKGNRGAAPRANAASVPDFDDAFGDILQENDKTENDIMRKIWKELQETHRTSVKS